MYFNNDTHIETDTLPLSARTYFGTVFGSVDVFGHNPWRSPGSAPLASPCGVGGGNPRGCGGATVCPGGGYAYGTDARLMDFPNAVTSKWVAGTVVEAAWGIVANHGGGYSYRLCKVPEDQGHAGLTEECFAANVLEFAEDKSYIQWGRDPASRKVIDASRISTGTYPEGSTWAKNPVPACVGLGGGYDATEPLCEEDGGHTQFDPPLPGVLGFGQHIDEDAPGGFARDFEWSLVDKLRVPEGLPPGQYALSWRWDCDQTPQGMHSCPVFRAHLHAIARARATPGRGGVLTRLPADLATSVGPMRQHRGRAKRGDRGVPRWPGRAPDRCRAGRVGPPGEAVATACFVERHGRGLSSQTTRTQAAKGRDERTH